MVTIPRVVCQPCVKVKACVEVCPVGAIKEGPDQSYIDPDVCIDCETCEDTCPVCAIYPLDKVPDKWKEYIQKNARFFGR